MDQTIETRAKDNEHARYRACRDAIEPMLPEWEVVCHDTAKRTAFCLRVADIYAAHGFTAETYLIAMNRRRSRRG